MKTAYVTYVANGYTLNASSNTARPPPVWVFAANIDEVIFYLDQYFVGVNPEGEPPPGANPLIFDVNTIADAAANPLVNQEAVVWPVLPSGFIVRQSQSKTRPLLEQYCPTMDDVHATLTAIFTAAP